MVEEKISDLLSLRLKNTLFYDLIEINPDLYEYYELRGECNLYLMHYKGAIEDFD